VTVSVPQGRVGELLDACCRAHSDAPALETGSGDSLAFSELGRRVRAVSDALHGAGVPSGALVEVRADDFTGEVLGVLGAACADAAAVLPPESAAVETHVAALVHVGDEVTVELRSAEAPVRGTEVPLVATAGGGVTVDALEAWAQDEAGAAPAGEPGTCLLVRGGEPAQDVLAAIWPLLRGWRVVVADGPAGGGANGGRPRASRVDLSLFYFASSADGVGSRERYRLLVEGARFADRHGFSGVWTPERHFQAFGGPYPNPAVTGAAVAAVTERLEVRAGSVVLPLHDPLRVAEEWAVVDGLSGGRVSISFASGWLPDDFVLAPESFQDRKAVMLDHVETVRRLWRGESVERVDGAGREIAVRVFPPPVQSELPVWLTSAGDPQTFAAAGRIGAGLLTHLLGQDVGQLEAKLRGYRDAWTEAGHPGRGRVALMLHAYVEHRPGAARSLAREPFKDYLRNSLGLLRQMTAAEGHDVDLSRLGEDELDAVLGHFADRFSGESGLIGTPAECRAMLDRVRELDVDDAACLVDFGVDPDAVLEGLPLLADLISPAGPAPRSPDDLARAARSAGATHVQRLGRAAAESGDDGLAALPLPPTSVPDLARARAVLDADPRVAEADVRLDGQGTDRRLVARVRLRDVDSTTDGEPVVTLPNGMLMTGSRQAAMELYEEVFERRDYLRDGLLVPDGACVLDVGANAGMASLFFKSVCPTAEVHAFEPIPATHAALTRNLALNSLDAVAYRAALGARPGSASFTYYPELPGMSGRYADPAADRERALEVLRDLAAQTGGGADDDLAELVERRYRHEEHVCEITTVSDVLEQIDKPRVDLLKIDVERAELDVLDGVRDEDWARIAQVVVEVEGTERRDEVVARLRGHGYDVSARTTMAPRVGGRSDIEVALVYARRPGYAPAVAGDATGSAAPREGETARLRELLARALPGLATPIALALEAGAEVEAEPQVGVEAATADLIARTWAEVLGRGNVGRNENFFDVGGNSMLLIEVGLRLKRLLPDPPSIVDLFTWPTVNALAEQIDGRGAGNGDGAGDERRARRTAALRAQGRRRRRIAEDD
jgi:natural product biosynthesis luciferase-like monooxygenase protein/FkbM family methyltransferase